MDATILDLRRNTKKIVAALERNESVTLTKRGRKIGTIVPEASKAYGSIADSPAVGMWRDREDMKNPAEFVRKLRTRRRYAV